MTTRERHHSSPLQEGILDVWEDDVLLTSVSTVLSSMEKSMWDTVTDGYHTRIKNGEIINNSLVYDVVSEEAPEMGCVFTRVQNASPFKTYTVMGSNVTRHYAKTQGVQYPDTRVDDLESLKDIAKQRCLSDVDSTPFEFFEDLMEIRETLRFLRDPLSSIKKITKAYSKDRKKLQGMKDLRRKAEAASDLWNSYRFAAAPLLRSAMTAWEAVNLPTAERVRPERRSSHCRRLVDNRDAGYFTSLIGPTSCFYRTASVTNVEVHATILYEVSNPIFDYPYMLGLRAKDYPQTLWEIFPASFMIDRLYDLKSAIGGLVNLVDPTVSILAGSITVKDQTTTECSLIDYENASYSPVTISSPDTWKKKHFHMTRDVWVPSWSDTIPTLTPKYLVNDLTYVADLLSISIALLKPYGRN